MDEFFNSIVAETTLDPLATKALQNEGFVVIAGPLPESKIAGLANSYHVAISESDPIEIAELCKHGLRSRLIQRELREIMTKAVYRNH